MSKMNVDSSYSQAKARAGLEDPFGTLRAKRPRRVLEKINTKHTFNPSLGFSKYPILACLRLLFQEHLYAYNTFDTLCAFRATTAPKSMDLPSVHVFTTVVFEVAKANSQIDYKNLN